MLLDQAGVRGQLSSVVAAIILLSIGLALSKQRSRNQSSLVSWLEKRVYTRHAKNGNQYRTGMFRGEVLLFGTWALWIVSLVFWRTGDGEWKFSYSAS